jgi:hypothetical protein
VEGDAAIAIDLLASCGLWRPSLTRDECERVLRALRLANYKVSYCPPETPIRRREARRG